MTEIDWGALASPDSIAKLHDSAPEIAKQVLEMLNRRVEQEARMLDQEMKLQDALKTLELQAATQNIDLAADRERRKLEQESILLQHNIRMDTRRLNLDVAILALAVVTVGAAAPVSWHLADSGGTAQAMSIMTAAVTLAGGLFAAAWRSGRLGLSSRIGNAGEGVDASRESPNA